MRDDCDTADSPGALPVAVAQIGARHHDAVPIALERAGMLHALHTDWCANGRPSRVMNAVVPHNLRFGLLRKLLDRRIPDVPAGKVRTYPWFSLSRRLAGRRVRSSANQYERYLRANETFGRLVARRGFGSAGAVYGFNAAALEILEKARSDGLRTVVDQVMAPWGYVNKILAEERRRWPGWGEDAPSNDAWGPLAAREAAEWEMADLIVCASEFVVRGVEAEGGSAARCCVIPYGFDAHAVRPIDRSGRRGALRVLFLGTLELRKGVPYLLEAARKLHSRGVEFRAVGPVGLGERATGWVRSAIDVTGPVPWSSVPQQLAWADLFVLPTVAEGSALVCYEALAHGLPVITTPNCGSVVRDGVDGWIVPIRDSDALALRMEQCARDRSLLQEMSQNAAQRAKEFTWDRYHKELPEALCKAFQNAIA